MRFIRVSLLVCLSVGMQIPTAEGDPPGPIVNRTLQYTGSLYLSNRPYAFEVVIRRSYPEPWDSTSSSGVTDCYGARRKSNPTVVDTMSMVVSGREQFIPPEAYSDLCEVNMVCGFYIGEDADSIFIHLTGGEGRWGSYNSSIVLYQDSVRYRLLEYDDSLGKGHSEFKRF